MASPNRNTHIIYCDGACSGNPGPGGWAFVLGTVEGWVTEGAAFVPGTTNNRMELLAAVEGLELLLKQDSKSNQVLVFSDSVYVIRGVTQWVFGWRRNGWKTAQGDEVLNRDLWERFYNLVHQSGLKIQFRYVKGHAGIDGNERCDVLAVQASKHDSFELYSGPKENYRFNIDDLPPEVPLPEMKSKSSSSVKEKVNYISLVNGKIYRDSSWSACEARVKGRPGVKFKKVKSASEEKSILESWGASSSTNIEGDGRWD